MEAPVYMGKSYVISGEKTEIVNFRIQVDAFVSGLNLIAPNCEMESILCEAVPVSCKSQF